MKRWKMLLPITILSAALIIGGCAGAKKSAEKPQEPEKKEPAKTAVAENTLTAVKVTSSPMIDGKDDDMWNQGQDIKVEIAGGGSLQGSGGNFKDGKTQVRIKSLYDTENIYMQLKWEDPTESIERGPWRKEGGKLVKKDYKDFYEDKMAINWNINDSTANFNASGCSVTCHVTDEQDKDGKTIIKHWTNGDKELLDMWHWKLTRQNNLFGPDKPGLMHDQFMDNVKFDPKDETKKGAGRHADPGEKDYVDNATGKKPDWGKPQIVFDGAPVNGNKYVIVKGLDKTKPYSQDYFNKLKDGDTIPGAIANQLTGDPADITAKGKYENGTWTLELKRKLTTNSDKDVQFKDLNKQYVFAIAGFDNSQIGHAYQNGINVLVFKQ